jgi:hypothetical protein
MDVDDEIMQYLQLLLDHSNECRDEGCPSHAQLHQICGIIRERIFSGPVVLAGHERTPSPRSRHRAGAAGRKS